MSLTMETTTTWVSTCEVDDLEPGWGEVALLGRTQVALLRLDEEEVYAVDHHDPHTGAPVMARGIVGSRGDRPTIASPLHKEVYDLGTGECFTDSALALRTYRTRIVGGMIEVELER
ncbi:nitrite reductase small subunit NirD [Agromyces cerinus]|uniref:Assimilatory nitrite reductase (NAD(P)H) small subunit n=1 Tax=Agromyces cerinus subsp. cerinus TaxID=232089 RepID=A0A1N6DMS9_9MICO|nr:nitrite reductase small subunit NirD [Agromyces cerinus]SIN71973.1 assimilatory nitrite reductase (NAD(P)H) small subunit [Agromyces cerinus subsp. cerinus]